jgi:hypothetical protein
LLDSDRDRRYCAFEVLNSRFYFLGGDPMRNPHAPKARKNGLVIQEAGDEVLVYDLERNEARCLNRTAAFVWKSCDGKTDVAEIAAALGREFSQKVDEDLVWLAIDQLSGERLLEESVRMESNGLSRRSVIKKIGLAAAVALPVVAMLSFPGSALAVTCAASFCNTNDPNSGCNGDYCCRNPGGQYICQVAPCTTSCV